MTPLNISCTTLAELKMDSWNLSIRMHFDSNKTWRWWKYTIAVAGKYQQDKDVEEPVSKDLETLQLPQNLDQQTQETFPHVHLASIK